MSSTLQSDIEILWNNSSLEFKYIIKNIFNNFDFENPIIDDFVLDDDDDSDDDDDDESIDGEDIIPILKESLYANKDDPPILKFKKYLKKNKTFIKNLNISSDLSLDAVSTINQRLQENKYKFYIYIDDIKDIIDNFELIDSSEINFSLI